MVSSEFRDLAGSPGELQDMHPGVRAIDDVDVAAVVDLEVVGLDRHLAALLAIRELHAALVGLAGFRRNVITDFLRLIRVADIDGAHAGVEPGDEHQALRVHRRLVFVGRVSAEAAATRAEITACLGHVETRDGEGLRLRGHVGEPHPLARFTALVRCLLVDDHHEIAHGALRVSSFNVPEARIEVWTNTNAEKMGRTYARMMLSLEWLTSQFE